MKVLLLDIETAPLTAYVWGLFKENIPIQRVIDSGHVLCWSAKWLGDDTVMFDSVHKSKPKRMLQRVHALLNDADVVIHYNGSRFDIPTLNKEFVLKGISPPSPYKQIDLLTTARRRFRFASNKLDYIAQMLGVGKKHAHEGFELWVKCMAGDDAAWKIMEEYNKQDVQLLEAVYHRFRPWIRNHPNVALFGSNDQPSCPVCGSTDLHRRGYAVTATSRYQRFQCTDCGHWSRSRLGGEGHPEIVSDK